MVFFLFVCCLLFILFLFRQQNQFTPRPTGGAPAAEQLRPCADPPCPDGYLTTLGVFHRLFESEFLGFFLFFSFVWSFSAVPGLSCQVQSKGANFPPRISPPFSLRFLCCSLILIFLWRFLSLRIFILVLGFFFNYYFKIFSLILAPEHPTPGPPGATTSKEVSAWSVLIPLYFMVYSPPFFFFAAQLHSGIFQRCYSPLPPPPPSPHEQIPQSKSHKIPREKGINRFSRLSRWNFSSALIFQQLFLHPSIHPSMIHPTLHPSIHASLPPPSPHPPRARRGTNPLPLPGLCSGFSRGLYLVCIMYNNNN